MLLVATSVPIAQERGTGEGIKVHGHWTIDVKNPDGTLASHHEFENALDSSGPYQLAALLSGQGTLDGWGVYLADAGFSTNVTILDQKAASSFPSYLITGILSTNLTVTETGPQATLQGSATATSALQIGVVGTYMGVLLTSGPPVQAWAFSQRVLPQPITLQAGQIVQVSVVFSFS